MFRTAIRILGCLLLFSFAFAARGQTARFTGQVTDPQNAAVPNAQVRVFNLESSTRIDTKTDASGAFVVPYLPAGRYRIEVQAPGFSQTVGNDFNLAVGQALIYDVQLKVGSVGESVDVSASSSVATEVNTENSEVSNTIIGKEVAGIQLNGRNFTQLIVLTPGVSNQTGQDEAKVGVLGSVAYSVNGGRTEYNSFQVDGSETLNVGINKDHSTLLVYPSIDAIQEIKVLTSNYGAQYPSTGNGTTIVTTKSGSDQYHGNVYEFFRNEALNAKGYFDIGNRAPLYRRNDFGGTFGGPFRLPHLYDSRGKTHFFFSEEVRLETSPTAYRQAVPSLAERNGDFSDVCPGVDCPGLSVPVSATATALLDNGIIPVPNSYRGCNSTIASCYLADASLPTYYREELFRIDHKVNEKNQLGFRYIHDEWDTTTPIPQFSYVTNSFPTIQNRFYGPGLDMVARLTTAFSATALNEFIVSYSNSHITLADTPQFGVTLSRPAVLDAPPAYKDEHGNPIETGGLGNIFANGYGGKMPGIIIGGTNAAYGGAGFTVDPSYTPWSHNNPVYSLSDNVTKILGRHNVTAGGQWVLFQRNQTNGPIGAASGDVQGLLTFSNEQSAVTTGNAFADFVSGSGVSSYQQDSGQGRYYQRYQIFEPYLQDDWKITPRLTLNAGVRVSVFGIFHEKNHNAYNWESSSYDRAIAESVGVDGVSGQLFDAVTGAAIPIFDSKGNPDRRLTNGIVRCGVNGVPDGCMKGHLWNPAPRVGFAWDPRGDGRTSIRAGYGVFFEHGTADEANTGSLEGSAPKVLSMTQRNIPAIGCIGNQAKGCSSLGPGAFPLNLTAIPTKAVWPYIQQWSFSVERELPWKTLLVAAYVGSKGTHLTAEREINQLKPVLPSQNPYGPHQPLIGPDCGTGVDPTSDSQSGDGNGGYKLANGAVVPVTSPAWLNLTAACSGSRGGSNIDPNKLRQYAPGLGNIYSLENVAVSRYNALQVTVRHTQAPLTLGVAYTYSHSLDNSSDRSDSTFVDSFNLKGNTASSNFDQRHLFHVSYIYDLPFPELLRGTLGRFPKRRDAGGSPSANLSFDDSAAAKLLFGGWQLSGLTLFETGIPFTVVNQGASYAINNQNYSFCNNPTFFAFNRCLTTVAVSSQDNAGAANGVGASAYPDLVGNVRGKHAATTGNSFGPLLLNPGAFAAPRGLTFGNAGRNALNNPNRWNWDTALVKHFAVKERLDVEFRAEAFNVFNHTQFRIYNPTLGNQPQNEISCYGPATANYSGDWAGDDYNRGCLTGSAFLHPIDAHRPRTLQFGLKVAF